MKPLILTIALFLSQNVMAQAGLSPFDKLQNLYRTATAPKSADAVLMALSKATKCAHAVPSRPNELNSDNKLSVLTQTIPGQGPEFPSVTNRWIVMLVGSETGHHYSLQHNYRLSVTAQELQLDTMKFWTEAECNDKLDDCWDESKSARIQMSIKLSAQYVHYQIGNEAVGYCWKP